MIVEILVSLAVLVGTVGIQVVAVLVMIRHLSRLSARGKLGEGLGGDIAALSTLMVVLFVGHLLQIAIWAKVFMMIGEFPDFRTAFYHSAVNFASLGYGDMVMSEKWRLLGALEAGNGVLMFGLSAAGMYAILMQMINRYQKKG